MQSEQFRSDRAVSSVNIFNSVYLIDYFEITVEALAFILSLEALAFILTIYILIRTSIQE